MRKIKAELILFLVAAIWGGTFVIIKVTLNEISPFYFLTLRFLIALILFVIIFYKHLNLSGYGELKAGFILGLLLFLGFASQTTGLLYTTASNSALITGINTLIVPFAQRLIIKKKVGIENWIGVAVVLFGLYLLTNPKESGINKGDLLTLVCAFAWAFYIIYLDIFSRKFNLYVLVFVQFLTVLVFSIFPAVAFENFSEINLSSVSLSGLFYTAVPATLIATFLVNKYQKDTTPVKAALIFMFEQPSAVFIAIIFISEIFTITQSAGGILMISGILFSVTFEYIKLVIHNIYKK